MQEQESSHLLLLHAAPAPACDLDLPGFHVGQALLETAGIDFVRLATLNRLLCDSKRLFFLAKLIQRVGLGRKIPEGLLHFDRLVQPRHALRIIGSVFIVDEKVSSLHQS